MVIHASEKGNYEETLCYPQFRSVICFRRASCFSHLLSITREYLSNSTVRDLLGAPLQFPDHNDTAVNWEMAIYWFAHLESLSVRTEYYVENLLDRGIRVLLYAGAHDWIANWIGIWNMVQTLEWGRVGEFSQTEWREWGEKGDQAAGKVKDGGGLTFATIAGAGHMVRFKNHGFLLFNRMTRHLTTSPRKACIWFGSGSREKRCK